MIHKVFLIVINIAIFKNIFFYTIFMNNETIQLNV